MTLRPLLQVTDLRAGYGLGEVLRGVDLAVDRGEILAVLGRNGSGRSTLLQATMGLLPARGRVRLDGTDLGPLPPHRRARLGLGYVAAHRAVFDRLSVQQNLQLGILPARPDAPRPGWTESRVLDHFAPLRQRLHAPGWALSGGERQLLAIARALLGNPRALLLDEPTEGLAPRPVDATAALLRQLRDDGMAIVLVEQRLQFALDLADRVAVLGDGRIEFTGSPAELDERDAVSARWLAP